MKAVKHILITVVLAFVPATIVSAHEFIAFGSEQQDCFAKAMIGMDSVINSRLGVPPEHALDLTVQTSHSNPAEVKYDNRTLNIILAAYLWNESPHGYAVNVFYKCAQENAFNRQAKSEQ